MTGDREQAAGLRAPGRAGVGLTVRPSVSSDPCPDGFYLNRFVLLKTTNHNELPAANANYRVCVLISRRC